MPFEPEVFGEALQAELAERVAQEKRDLAALEQAARRRPGSRSKTIIVGRRIVVGLRERGVQLEVGQVREPDERRQVVGEQKSISLSPAVTRGRHPVRAVRRALLLVEVLALDAVRVALQRQRPVAQVRQQRPARRACSSRSPGPW